MLDSENSVSRIIEFINADADSGHVLPSLPSNRCHCGRPRKLRKDIMEAIRSINPRNKANYVPSTVRLLQEQLLSEYGIISTGTIHAKKELHTKEKNLVVKPLLQEKSRSHP